jgi:hypothetical protein
MLHGARVDRPRAPVAPSQSDAIPRKIFSRARFFENFFLLGFFCRAQEQKKIFRRIFRPGIPGPVPPRRPAESPACGTEDTPAPQVLPGRTFPRRRMTSGGGSPCQTAPISQAGLLLPNGAFYGRFEKPGKFRVPENVPNSQKTGANSLFPGQYRAPFRFFTPEVKSALIDPIGQRNRGSDGLWGVAGARWIS